MQTKPQILDLFDNSPTFDNFIDVNNKIITNALKNYSSQFTHITGSYLSGKTHLLRAWANLAKTQLKRSSVYINAAELEHKIDIRSLAAYYEYIALDNIEQLTDQQQVALFDLFNSIKLNNRNNLLLTSSLNSIDHNPKIREDLKTRILSGLNLNLKAPSDEELTQILKIYASKEGININDSELNYLINHYTRNVGTLINTMHMVVDSAIAQNRHITIPLIKQVIGHV